MTPEQARELRARGRAEPGWWAHEILGIDLWADQVRALKSWRDNRHTSWRSCNGVGKTLGDGAGVLWIGSCWEDTSILTTATTFTQAKGSLWGEIDHLVRNARKPVGCVHLTTELRWPHGSKAFAITAPPTEKHKAKMQGFRGRKRTFVLGDEASGLSSAILDGIDSMLTGAEAHKLLTGNPLDPTTEFKRTFDRPGVEKIKTDAFDTPNLKTFGITLADIINETWREKVTGPYPCPALTTPEWVEDQWIKCGKDVRDPIFMARVLAEFPEASPNTVIPLHWIEAAFVLGAQDRKIDEPQTPCHLGVDVARYGDDDSVITRRRGIRAKQIVKVHGHDTMQVAGAAVIAHKEEKSTEIRVDTVGVGAGVCDRLRELGLPAIDVCASASAMDQNRFGNLRSETWWSLRERFEATYKALHGEKDLRGVPFQPQILLEQRDDLLASELNAPRWTPNSKGHRVVEPKEETKARLGRSPDRADALGLAFVAVSGSTTALKLDAETNYAGAGWQP